MTSRTVMRILRWTVSAAILAFLYWRIDFAEMAEVLARTRFLPLLPLFLLLTFNTAISAYKWKVLLAADGGGISYGRLFCSYLIGSFLNIFLPSNIGGDAYRIYDVARQSKRAGHSFASVLTDRLTGFVALVLLGFLFGFLGFRSLPDRHVFLLPVVAMLGLLVLIGLLLQQRLARWGLDWPFFDHFPKVRAFGHELLDSVAQYSKSPGLILRVLGLSFVFQFSAIACIYLLARVLDFQVPFFFFCVVVPFISLMEALPISIYGLGIRDATYVFFFTRAGLSEAQALTLAMTYVAVTLLYSLSGGILLALRRQSPEQARPA